MEQVQAERAAAYSQLTPNAQTQEQPHKVQDSKKWDLNEFPLLPEGHRKVAH